jgi:hypothetical protein
LLRLTTVSVSHCIQRSGLVLMLRMRDATRSRSPGRDAAHAHDQTRSGVVRVVQGTINRLMWSGKLRSSTVGSRRLIEYASFVKALGINQSESA